MKKQTLLSLFIAAGCGMANAQGISFDTTGFKSVVAKAKTEHKLIYADIYTTWCGPCKLMVEKVFPEKKVGDKYNALFVSTRIDAEKGEGIALAKKYGVTGYPTHLFIDPATQNLVYKDMGANTDLDAFNEHADVAIAESKDHMSWKQYGTKFNTSKKDTAFLRAYLAKAKHLDKNNDTILDTYISALNTSKLSLEEVEYIFSQIKSINNKTVDLVYAHRAELDKKNAETKNYVQEYIDRWTYQTFLDAVNTNNPKLIDVIIASRKKYFPEEDEREADEYRTNFYAKTGDEKNFATAAARQANYLASIPVAKYLADDKAKEADILADLHQFLVAMKVPEDKMDAVTKKNLTPSRLHPFSAKAANSLNTNAWWVYEKQPGNKELVKQALTWSAYSLSLTETLPDEYPMFEDTYAHLLFVAGEKEKAIAAQTDAIARLKSMTGQEAAVAELEESLTKMKAGKL